MTQRGRPPRDAVYRRLDEAVRELREWMGGLPGPAEAEDIRSNLWHRETHNSTAIEGNTLILREVEQLLEEGRAVGSKPLRDYLEVRAYADAAHWVYGRAIEPGEWIAGALVSLQEIRHIHHVCMSPAWQADPHPDASGAEGPGSFRRHQFAAFPGGMQPPSWVEVEGLMRTWVTDAAAITDADAEPLPEALARTHNDFERIHPFLDGNGRTGRLVLNLMLGRLGYPPAIIYKRERDRYLRAMRRADQGEYGPLGELIARSVTDNLHKFVIPAVAGPVKLVPLTALASDDITENALRVAATRGRLRAVKGDDGTWRSSKNWVDQYLANRYKRNSVLLPTREENT
ncbi:MAG: Fic family protein [Propionibacteriales bacterium]|nr:Fic family protein [Propionibacteriales bacterium]